ncbi:MAG: FHA domain-containing protein [Acidimicrobiales bacterium]|nr:FHA domain-containing protein [Acidimicrobiaceae bacterium]MXV87305.1 FHA domain-containing protein [Acidimicrobiales bacterium]MXX41968.1 FHA domain-containing protein [Acidimicrobiales bacterium]MXZ14562.1 FHA domain-containing protein [Acidimicrobiales bacterium]MYA25310.1 FHA domain-containing protein [Acidimicrobiales bacterium]
MAIVCGRCGYSNADDARFCSACGTSLDSTADAPTEVLSAVGVTEVPPYRGQAELVVTSGHRSGTRFELAGDRVTVGRHPDSDVFLDDITVSRRHVVLELGPAGHILLDVGSLNGTYINGVRTDGEVTLHSGDELQVGKFKLLYLISSIGL